MARVAKTKDKADAGVGCKRRDGRRRGILDRSLNKTRSKGRDVKTADGACRGVVCWFRRVDVPGPQCCERWWRRDVAGDGHARRALGSYWSGEKAAVTASYGSGGYSDRSGRCWDAVECRGQQDGALWLGEVGSQHGQGNKIGHSGWHRPQRMTSATAVGIDHTG